MEILEVLERGVENFYPNKEFVLDKLRGNEPLTFYFGIDPTGPSLHLGHAINLKKLGEIQKLGHKVILLIGDFTARIGDPSGKDALRKPLSEKEVVANYKIYKKQASIFLTPDIHFNSKWLAKLKMEELLGLASHLTVDQLLKRDMFMERQKAGRPIFLHEFLYPLLQGYDSVAMKVDGELGGNDQTFNMLLGRQLEKQILNKEKMVITMKLLADSSGQKMGKTEGNMVALSDKPNEMFRKITGWGNEMIVPGFKLCTDVSLSEIQKMETELKGGGNPKLLLAKLAREIIKIYHGEKAAREATAVDNIFAKQTNLIDALIGAGIVKSKSEVVRLINSGAISLSNGEKITDKNYPINETTTLHVGKRVVRIDV